MNDNGMKIQEYDSGTPDVDELKKNFDKAKANLSFWMDKAENGLDGRTPKRGGHRSKLFTTERAHLFRD